MSSGGDAGLRRRPVDAVALARTRARLESAPQPPWLHQEAARRMAGRLQLIRHAPRHVVDWWPRAGGSEPALGRALPAARIYRPGRPGASAWWERWRHKLAPRARREAGTGVDLVWANMLLHHALDPRELFGQWHGALATGGFLMFSTLGPGSLRELRELYRAAGWGDAMGELVDMHDLGDMLVEAGFADPVMDQELVTLTWRSAEDALAELRSMGSNVSAGRHPGLRTPRWRQQLLGRLASLGRAGRDGRIELAFELVYGHAVKPEPRVRVAPEARIGVDELRRALRRPPGGRPA